MAVQRKGCAKCAKSLRQLNGERLPEGGALPPAGAMERKFTKYDYACMRCACNDWEENDFSDRIRIKQKKTNKYKRARRPKTK